jgi:hypothetical protein
LALYRYASKRVTGEAREPNISPQNIHPSKKNKKNKKKFRNSLVAVEEMLEQNRI